MRSSPARRLISLACALGAFSPLLQTTFAATETSEASTPTSTEAFNGMPVTVLSRSTTALPNGTVTFVKIRPPRLTAPPPPPVRTAPEPTADELAAEARRAAKEHRTIGLTAITYAGTPTVTELSWTRQDDGRRFVAYSPVDFTHLTQLQDIETSSAVYLYFPFVSPGEPAELAPGLREALAAAASADADADSPPSYLFLGDETDVAAEANTLELLDVLHAHWALHAPALVADTARRQAEAAERERQAAVEATRPKHHTIYFWKIENPAATTAP